MAYLFGAIILTTYVPEYEARPAATPAATPLLFIPFVLILLGLYRYRNSLLLMDEELIFEEPQIAGPDSCLCVEAAFWAFAFIFQLAGWSHSIGRGTLRPSLPALTIQARLF